MNNADLQPLKKKFQSTFAFVNVDQIKANVSEMIKHSTECFAEPADTVGWELMTRDGRRSGEKSTDNLQEILNLYDEQACCVSIDIYKRRVTQPYGLKIYSDEHVSLIVNFEDRELLFKVGVVGESNVTKLFEAAIRGITMIGVILPEEHKYLEAYLRQFHLDHPDSNRNVFLVMRFQDQPPFPEIVDSIKIQCATHDLKVLRADDKEYTDDLWDNVLTYLYGCSSAIAVFDQVNYREFNPNVSLEVGFLLAQCKKVLLLKDSAIPTMPTDIVGKIYRSFNTYQPKETIPPQVERWITNYKIGG